MMPSIMWPRIWFLHNLVEASIDLFRLDTRVFNVQIIIDLFTYSWLENQLLIRNQIR